MFVHDKGIRVSSVLNAIEANSRFAPPKGQVVCFPTGQHLCWQGSSGPSQRHFAGALGASWAVCQMCCGRAQHLPHVLAPIHCNHTDTLNICSRYVYNVDACLVVLQHCCVTQYLCCSLQRGHDC